MISALERYDDEAFTSPSRHSDFASCGGRPDGYMRNLVIHEDDLELA